MASLYGAWTVLAHLFTSIFFTSDRDVQWAFIREVPRVLKSGGVANISFRNPNVFNSPNGQILLQEMQNAEWQNHGNSMRYVKP